MKCLNCGSENIFFNGKKDICLDCGNDLNEVRK